MIVHHIDNAIIVLVSLFRLGSCGVLVIAGAVLGLRGKCYQALGMGMGVLRGYVFTVVAGLGCDV